MFLKTAQNYQYFTCNQIFHLSGAKLTEDWSAIVTFNPATSEWCFDYFCIVYEHPATVPQQCLLTLGKPCRLVGGICLRTPFDGYPDAVGLGLAIDDSRRWISDIRIAASP